MTESAPKSAPYAWRNPRALRAAPYSGFRAARAIAVSAAVVFLALNTGALAQSRGIPPMSGAPWPDALQPRKVQPAQQGPAEAPTESPAESSSGPEKAADTPPADHALQPSTTISGSAPLPPVRPAELTVPAQPAAPTDPTIVVLGQPGAGNTPVPAPLKPGNLPNMAPLPPERPDFGAAPAASAETNGDDETQPLPQVPSLSSPGAGPTDASGLPGVAPLPPVRPNFPLEVRDEPATAPAIAPPAPPQQTTKPSWWPFGRKDDAEAPLDDTPAGRHVVRPTVTDSDVDACVARLRKAGAVVERIPPVINGGCGVRNGVRLSALPGGIPLSKPGTLTCAMAEATAAWLRGVAQPAARQRLQADITAVITGPTYACRTMNHQRGAKISEHGYANAIDIAGFELGGRKDFMVRPSHATSGENLFQAFIRKNACRVFDTVIGPGGDRFHNDHLHLDLRNRGSGRQVCR